MEKNNFKTNLLISEVKRFLKSSFWLTPLNLNEEKLKVLRDYKYNPLFIYPKMPLKKIQAYIDKIRKLEFRSGNDNYKDIILGNKLEELSFKLKLLLARGTGSITKFSGGLYRCKFGEKSIMQAEKDSQIKAEFKPYEDLSVRKLAREIKRYLGDYRLYDWSVELSNLSDFYMRVKPTQKRILVSHDFNWDFADLDNTLAHEIDGHVLRTVNAQKQKEEIFRVPLPFYLKTEEGLASFLGDYCSTTSEISRKHHAVKYLSGKLAITEGFSGVYEYLMSFGFTPELAFRRTFRLKRGFGNTSQHGCYMKEAVYYEGMLEIKDYIDSDGDIEKLYSGKFGLDDLEYAPLARSLIIPQRLKKYLDMR